MPYTHIYFLPNIFLSYVVAILRKYPCENYSSKVAGCRWTVGGWTVFQRLWLHISSPFSKIPIFHVSLFERQLIFHLLFRQKYLLWNYVHSWKKVVFSENLKKKYLILTYFLFEWKIFLLKIATITGNVSWQVKSVFFK